MTLEESRTTPVTTAPTGRTTRSVLGGLIRRARGWRGHLLHTTAGAPDSRRGLGTALFAATPLLYLAHQALTNPQSVLGGQMWAEMATNYYATTQTQGLIGQLLAVDAGYIPLPQRIVGALGWLLGLAPASIPYYYTFAAVLGTAILVGSICLPVFRPVLRSDLLRFAVSTAILLVLDTETRSFINFTYVGVVPIVFLSALAATGHRVPRWALFLPVLMLSKPAVLTVLPVVVIAAVIARRRFRVIAALSIAAATVQLIRLGISSTLPGSLLQQGPPSSPLEKSVVAAQYTAGFLGRFVFTPGGGSSNAACIELGVLVVVVAVALLVLSRSGASVLVSAGLMLVAADMVLSAVVYANWFNADLASLSLPVLDRRVTVAVIGAIFCVAGVAAIAGEARLWAALRRRLGLRWAFSRSTLTARSAVAAGLFTAWFVGVGWGAYSSMVNAPRTAPLTDVSQWQDAAPALSSGREISCVPLAPFGWAYGVNCNTLANVIPLQLDFHEVERTASGRYSVPLPVPASVSNGSLAALSVVAAPSDAQQPVRAVLTVTTADGGTDVFRAEDRLPVSGGSLLFESDPVRLVERPKTVTLTFDAPVRLGWATVEDQQEIAGLWMGQ